MPLRIVQHTTTAGQSYEDTNFVTGDSPRTIEIRDDLGNKPGNAGWFINDGPGDIQVEIQNNEQSGYSDAFTSKTGEMFALNGLNIRRIRLTWVSDSQYRLFMG